MSKQEVQLVAKLRQEIQILKEEVQTKEKHLAAQKQTNDNSKNHLAILRSKNQAQKEKIRELQTSLEAAILQKEELEASLVEGHLNFNHLQSRSAHNDRDNSTISVARRISQQKSEKNFPQVIGQVSVFQKSNYQISQKNGQDADQKKIESQLFTSEITITALEQKIKKLQDELQASSKDKQALKQKIQKLEDQKKRNQQAVLESLLPQENNYFSMDKVVESRKQYLDGQHGEEGVLMAPKSAHKLIFKSIMGHLDSVEHSKKVPFLQMLNVWSQQKLQRIYKSLQQLR